MADSEIAPFLNKLEYMLLAEVDSLQDVEDQLWRLHGMLTRLTPFLIMEAERKQSKDSMEERKKAMDEVITLVHEAEEVTDSYVGAIRRNDSSTDKARHIGSQIKGMMERLQGLHVRFLEFTDHRQSCSSSSKKGNDDVVVVLEDEVKRMIELLVLKDDEEEFGVIPIVGRGGMGKTTFARGVYNHPAIVEHFPRRLWIYVSNDYKLEEVLRDIIKQIKRLATTADDKEERKEMIMMSLKDLAIETYKLLKSTPTRYLLVFDDVCTTQFWADINIVFPDDNKHGGGGNRIIFTTRHDEVASHARPCKPPLCLRRLSKEESRELFTERVPGLLQLNSHSQRNPHDHPWKGWVDACGGIPVTIVALAEKYKEKTEKVGGVEFPQEIWKLIYNHLPHHLRACLIYLFFLQKSSVYQDDIEDVYGGFSFFEVKGLIVAEGLVKLPPPSSITRVVELEDMAEEYVKELIRRNLIKVTHWSFDGQIHQISISRWIVSLLDHQIINGISSSDDDVKISSNSNMKIQHVKNLGGWVLFEQDYSGSDGNSISRLRSLAVSKEKEEDDGLTQLTDWKRPRSLEEDITSLRVVILSERYPWLSNVIISYRLNLIHLRYLYLKLSSGDFKKFQEFLSDLWNLQFLKIAPYDIDDMTYNNIIVRLNWGRCDK